MAMTSSQGFITLLGVSFVAYAYPAKENHALLFTATAALAEQVIRAATAKKLQIATAELSAQAG